MAIYLSPDHPDLLDFLELRRPGGDENLRCRDLFLSLWVPDIFMRRVESGDLWSFFDPSKCPGLPDAWGADYDELYESYEREGKAERSMPARDVWTSIIRSQIESGTPYILYKDACNSKSNQQNVGTIRCSNLCVRGDTKILTSDGERSIKSLEGTRVKVWNGEEFSAVTVHQTGADQPLLTVKFDDGTSLHCTPYHKFFVWDHEDIIPAQDLKPGAQLKPWQLPCGTMKSVKVLSVENHHEVGDTYCFNEPKRHAGIFNGILTGNCSEIIEYTAPDEVAVCTLSSISLPAYVKNGAFDFKELYSVVRVAARNTDALIDLNEYPVPAAQKSNMRHRPIGMGVQGLADVFMMLGLPFHSADAAALNVKIFATLYHAAIDTSAELAKEYGSYETYHGSPASLGKLQYDLWGIMPDSGPGWLDWAALKAKVAKHGLRNSLSIAIMPTASTAQVMGNTESVEPVTSLLYCRRTLAGEFTVLNKHLVNTLLERDLWTKSLKDAIIENGGSIQNIAGIPQDVKDVFVTAYDLPAKTLIDQSAARGPYVCQSQSLNVFMRQPTFSKITSMLFAGWKKGLKTSLYYLRTAAAANAKMITIEKEQEPACVSCSA